MGNKSQSSYMDLYFKFQKRFKPVKAYESSKEIILEAVKILSEILKNQEEFAKNIKLIYPNYFTEKTGGRFKPIYDNFIFFIDENEELQKRVKQHLSYYMKTKNEIKLGDTFIRISSSLIQSKVNVTLSSFFVKKENDKYLLKIKKDARWLPESEIKVGSDGFPVLLNDINKLNDLELIKYSDDLAGAYVFYVKEGDLVSLPEKVVQVDSDFASSEVFIEAFAQPLSAHLVMLEEASMLYVYSQTAQIGSSASNLGYGGMFVLLDKGIYEPEDVDLYRDFFQLVSDSISSCIAHNIMRKKLLCEAVKSAKAAIMARNLSHNLGSHVMSYMKQDLSSVEDMISRRVLEEAYSKKDFPSGDVELPYLVGIGKFISYLQERQDYIATVSTDYIPYPSAVNFKDAIYDELNPDYRFQRHSEWKGHKPTNILLENIAKSEGLSRENETQKGNNIIIKYRNFDGLNHYGDGKEDYKELRQWNFSLPGGIMGRHAVFSIVENVIRNAAKHSSRTQDENLTLTFDIKDPILEKDKWKDDSFFRDYLNKEDTSDLYVVTLTDSANTDKERINFINRIVCDPFANDGEDLTASNKGLKEMVISAAWLRNIRIEEENNNSNKVPILRARSVEDHLQSVEGHLQYVFCLPKVKEVALITSNVGLLNAAKSDLWKQNGWYAYSVEDYKQLSSKNFNFILLDDKLLDNNLNSRKDEIRKCSNNRFFVAANETNLKQGKIKFAMSECINYSEDRKFREAEKDLFQQLANFNGQEVEIAISDGGEVNTRNCDYVCAMPDEQEISEKEYIYRKHNDTETDFLGFLANISGCDTNNLMPALNKVKFIEGITGGNSTDRLIRRNVRDEKWFYQHLHAMNTKVAIFDERLFTKISGYEMSQLHEGEKEVINWEDKLRDMSDRECQNYLVKYDLEHSRILIYDQIYDKSKNDIICLANSTYSHELPKNPCRLERITPLVYEKKGISVFTWTQVDKSKFAIWGLKNDFSEAVLVENRELKIGSYGQVEKIAELKIEHDESGIKPQVDFVGSRTYGFDYISIHQGLLDKIYEKMNPDGENKLAPKNKMAVTKAIHEKFARSCDYADNDYLPGLAIHSGRSKPNAEDMPQHQPFIQYSAIENAVSDCKYTLVELLDFACYE